MNLSNVNVHCETLQLARTRNLGDNSDAFGNKLMCILEYSSTFQHGACSLIDLMML